MEGNDYSFVDVSPPAGRSFYRIVETDAAGEQRYTAIISVMRVGEAAAFQIYPNPAHGSFTIQLNNATNEVVDVAIEDLSGSTVYRSSVAAMDGRVPVANVPQLVPGMYMIRVGTKNGVQTGKLMLH